MDAGLIDAVRSDEGDDLLRLLRSIYLEQESHGIANVDESTALLPAAERLDLVERRERGRFKLTTHGYRIANFAKEYINWIDGGRRLPEGVPPQILNGKRLLDVGCSSGRHMATFGRAGARAVGIELEFAYLELSRLLAARERIPRPTVVQATATTLPFASGSFDIVFCRLVLNYVNVRSALAEFARVLAPGGSLIVAFGTLQEGLDFVRKAKWRGNVRTVGWRVFGLLNTILLQATGYQASLRAGGRMYAVHTPTWPTPAWFGRELVRQGFAPPPGGFQVHSMPVVFHALRAGAERSR